jgi:hypothetical protein
VIVAEHPAEPLTARNWPCARQATPLDEPVAKSPVVALPVVVLDELLNGSPKVRLEELHAWLVLLAEAS